MFLNCFSDILTTRKPPSSSTSVFSTNSPARCMHSMEPIISLSGWNFLVGNPRGRSWGHNFFGFYLVRQNSHNCVIPLWKFTVIHVCDLSLVWRFVLREKITTHYCTPMYLLGHYVFFYFHLLVCVFTLLLPRYLFIDSLTQLLTRSLARAASLTTNLKRLHIYSSGSRSLEFKFLGAETLTVATGSDLDIKGQPDWYMYIFSHSSTGMETWIGLLDYWTFGLWTIFGPFFTPFYNWGGVGGVMVAFAACRCTPLATVYLFIIYSLTRAQVFTFNLLISFRNTVILLLFCIMCCLFHPFIVNWHILTYYYHYHDHHYYYYQYYYYYYYY